MDLQIEMTIRVTNNVTGKSYSVHASEPVDTNLTRAESAQRLLDSILTSKLKREQILEVENG